MKYIALSILLLINTNIFSQGTAAFTTEQLFFDKDYRKVETKDASYYTQTNYYQANKIMIDVNLTANRLPIEYREYVVEGNDTIPNGPWIKWYENTKKQYEYRYVKGVIVGKLTTFYDDGSKKREDEYELDGKLKSGKCYDQEGNETAYIPYLVEPSFVGNINDYFKKEIKLTKKAKKSKGTVEVLLTISEDGTIEDTKILKTPNEILAQEADRVICAMPSWEPGKIEGKPTKMKVTVPVVF